MLRRIAMGAVAATMLTLALTGCAEQTTSGAGSATNTSSSGGDATAWAEQVCKSVEDDIAKLSETPDVDPTNLEQTKDKLVAYLGDLATALGNLSSGIKDAGPPPVDGGTEVVDQTTTAIDDIKKSIDEAKATLAKASTSDPPAFQAAFQKVGEDLTKLSEVQDPTDGLKANKELDAAFDKAPTCQKIDLGGGSSSAPTS